MMTKKRKKQSVLDFFMSFISGKMIQDLDPRKSIKVVLVIFIFAIIIVGNTYYGQKQVSEIEFLKKNLTKLKYKQSIYRSDLMEITKQSYMSKQLKDEGLIISDEIPEKLILKTQSDE